MHHEQNKLALACIAGFVICWIIAFKFMLGVIDANRKANTPKMTVFEQVVRPDHPGYLSAKRFLVTIGVGTAFWFLAALSGK